MATTTSVTLRPARSARQLALAGLLKRISGNFVVRRVFKAFFTIFFVITLTFFLIRLLPGNPVEVYINTQMGQYGIPYQDAAAQAAALFSIDPNEPMYHQYLGYLGKLVRGDLGKSLISVGTPVSKIILQYLPWTLFSVGLSLLISFTLGIILGMIIAYRRETPLDHVLSTIGSLLHSIPNYLLAIIIVVFFGVRLGWLPITRMRGSFSPGVTPAVSLHFFADALYHAALPMAAYILTTIGSWMLIMKSSTLAALDEDYVTVARARGLKDSRIITAYVGRNAVLPLFTQLAVAIGFVAGGSLLVEPIFQYQGIGLVLRNAVNQRDYPVMQGIFLVLTFSVIVANLAADLLYGRLDPRIRVGNTKE
jgi:peptide/nickel transport system permease protein